MNRLISSALLLCLLSACSAPSSAPRSHGGEGEPQGASGPGVDTAGGLACGERTAAVIGTDDGHELSFCTFDGGRELVVEQAQAGQAPRIPPPARPAEGSRGKRSCALDLFLQHTDPGVPVPSALVASCARIEGAARTNLQREVRDTTVVHKALLRPDLGTQTYATVAGLQGGLYCGSSGAQKFQDDQCWSLCSTDPSECISACSPTLWSSSTRWCSESDAAYETVASCGGSTTVRAEARGDSSDPWSSYLETQVGHDRVIWVRLLDDHMWSDSDLRIRASSASGAWHRHAFECYDW